jgi:hypothetical protein
MGRMKERKEGKERGRKVVRCMNRLINDSENLENCERKQGCHILKTPL